MSAASADAVTLVVAEIPDAVPARSRARATVLRPTPRRPRTTTRSGAAARSAIAVTRGSARPAAKRASSSTKIWCPFPVMSCPFDPIGPIARPAVPPPAPRTSPRLDPFAGRPIGSHRMVASASPRCEPPFICYQPKATVGYQSGPGAATSGVHGPPWTNACATRGRDVSRRTGGSGGWPGNWTRNRRSHWRSHDPSTGAARFGPSRTAPPPGHEFPLAAFRAFGGPAPDLGAAVAGTGHLGRGPPRGSPPVVRSRWTPVRGLAARRRWCSRSAAAAAHPPWRWPRTSPIST